MFQNILGQPITPLFAHKYTGKSKTGNEEGNFLTLPFSQPGEREKGMFLNTNSKKQIEWYLYIPGLLDADGDFLPYVNLNAGEFQSKS